MFGVVLWCSDDSRKAVIWCEDHGDLAYSQDIGGDLMLEAGDLVRFRAERTPRMRMARDVILVDQDRFPGLPERLKAVGAAKTPGAGAEVLAFKANARHVRHTGPDTGPVATAI